VEEYFQSSDFVLPCENHLKYFFTGGVHSDVGSVALLLRIIKFS